MNNFVSIDTIIARILLEIGDEEHKRYYTRAAQWALDTFRRINVHESPFYIERKATLDEDLYYFEYPQDLVKLLAVGIYRHGEFWPLTKKPDMSLLPEDMEDEIYVEHDSENNDIVSRGYDFGAKGSNSFGYYVEDPEHCRVFVRNSTYISSSGTYEDTTSNILDKVIIRYKTTGIDCSGDVCVPTEAQDLIVALVTYKFAMKNIPFQNTADNKNRMEREIASLQEDYESLLYEPHNFWEVKDSIFASLNSTARR